MKGDKIRNSLWQIPVNFEQTNTARFYHAVYVLKTIDKIIYVLFVPVNGRHLTYQLSFPIPLPQKIIATNFACIWQSHNNKKLTFICAFFCSSCQVFFLAVVFIINWYNFDAYNVSNKVVSDRRFYYWKRKHTQVRKNGIIIIWRYFKSVEFWIYIITVLCGKAKECNINVFLWKFYK